MNLKLNADQLRRYQISEVRSQTSESKAVLKSEIYIILDNVLDTYNTGSIFRLADAIAAKKVYLCGETETPPNHRIKKASINTTEVVEWEYAESAVKAIRNLQLSVNNLQLVAIEQAATSVPYDKFEYKLPLALVVGNESTGISKEVLKLTQGIVELPMFGVNISLNVMVSLAVVLYKVIEIT